MLCPYDCSQCFDIACRFDGCRITGEAKLWPCEACGALIIRRTGHMTCMECIRITVTGRHS